MKRSFVRLRVGRCAWMGSRWRSYRSRIFLSRIDATTRNSDGGLKNTMARVTFVVARARMNDALLHSSSIVSLVVRVSTSETGEHGI